MFQTDIPYEICRCLAGQRFQFTVETGTAHIQERAQYVHCEIGIIHVLLDMSLYIRHEFPVETVGASGSCGGLFFCIDFQIRISLAQQCAVGKQIGNAGFQYVYAERFYNIFVRTDMESFENVLFISQCRQQYYRDVGCFNIVLDGDS